VKQECAPVTSFYFCYNIGLINLDTFRSAVADLGFVETKDLIRIFNRTPHYNMSFKEFLKALSSTSKYLDDNTSAGMSATGIRNEGEDIIAGTHKLPSRTLTAHTNFDKHSSNDLITWKSLEASKNDAKMFASRKKIDHTGSEGFADVMKDISSLTPSMPIATANSAYGPGASKSAMVDVDGGALRAEVYKAIRELDQNKITGATGAMFQELIYSWGLTMPPEATRLLEVHRYHGSVDFKSFVRAFEPAFQNMRVTVEMPAASTTSYPVTAERSPDIIGWNNSDEYLVHEVDEVLGACGRKKAVPVNTKKVNFLSWDCEGSEYVELPGKKRIDSFKNSEDFMSWNTSDPPQRARTYKSFPIQENEGTPFGTEADLPNEYKYQEFSTKVPKRSFTRKPPPKTGVWFDAVESTSVVREHRRAPFGTD
jgi:hypothetical protein